MNDSFLDKEGLTHLWNQIIARLNGKISQEDLDNLISVEDIDTICGGSIQHAEDVMF